MHRFTVKVAYNTDIVKIAKLTKIVSEKVRFQLWYRRDSQLPYIYLIKHQTYHC